MVQVCDCSNITEKLWDRDRTSFMLSFHSDAGLERFGPQKINQLLLFNYESIVPDSFVQAKCLGISGRMYSEAHDKLLLVRFIRIYRSFGWVSCFLVLKSYRYLFKSSICSFWSSAHACRLRVPGTMADSVDVIVVGWTTITAYTNQWQETDPRTYLRLSGVALMEQHLPSLCETTLSCVIRRENPSRRSSADLVRQVSRKNRAFGSGP